MFVAQIGRSSSHTGGIDETKMFKSMLREVGFRSMHIYDEVSFLPSIYIYSFLDFFIHVVF